MPKHEKSDQGGVSLEIFAPTPVMSFLQALTVKRMVKDEAHWLANSYPDVVSGYQSLSSSRQRIRKIGAVPEIQAYIIHGAKRAIGLATVIPDQKVVHPTEGAIEGDDLDYWLRGDSATRIHRAVLAELLAGQLHRPTFSTVATSDRQYIQKGLSMDRHMNAVGEPNLLRAAEEGDPFDVARSGAEVQVYQYGP
jgi:hypothetical protein